MPTGATSVAAVIGSPVRHSLSPAIHNAAFRAASLDWVYLAFEVAPGGAGDALDAMRTLGIRGLSVTMPHKSDVAALVDRLTPSAAALAAVNCVVNDGSGELVGHNTDGAGFIDSLVDTDLDIEGCRAVVFGAGGAGRAVVQALGERGAGDVVVVNRNPDRGADAAKLAGSVGRVGDAHEVESADLVVNATSVGMGAQDGDGDMPLDAALLGPRHTVVDLVYQPLTTPLLVAAEACGARAVGGLGMLVGQAAQAFELWTSVSAPLAAMHGAVAEHLAGNT
jgi:shikimate dehydrogenase